MAQAFLNQLLTTKDRVQSEDNAQCFVCLITYGTLTDTEAIEYVFSESMFPPLDKILSFETCLREYSLSEHVPTLKLMLQIGNTDCEIVIQMLDSATLQSYTGIHVRLYLAKI